MAQQSVTEAPAGPTPKVVAPNPVTPKGETPAANTQVSSETPRSYTQEEVDGLIQAAKSQQGRDHKTALDLVVSERNTLKTQLATKEGELTDIAAERDELTKRIEDLGSDDPERASAIKLLNDIRHREGVLKSERRKLEAEQATHAETIQEARNTMREITVWDVAAEHEAQGGNAERLMAILKEWEKDLGVVIRDEAGIRKVAQSLWGDGSEPSQKTIEPSVLNPYSGATAGGGANLRDLKGTAAVTAGLLGKKLR